jgi:hypothetical protein
MEARLRSGWLLVVGPALVQHTRLLRLAQGVLVVGCWEPSLVPSIRKSAEAAWPTVKERLERLWKLQARGMEIVPCDPPKPEDPVPSPRRDPDSLKAFLAFFRKPQNP